MVLSICMLDLGDVTAFLGASAAVRLLRGLQASSLVDVVAPTFTESAVNPPSRVAINNSVQGLRTLQVTGLCACAHRAHTFVTPPPPSILLSTHTPPGTATDLGAADTTWLPSGDAACGPEDWQDDSVWCHLSMPRPGAHNCGKYELSVPVSVAPGSPRRGRCSETVTCSCLCPSLALTLRLVCGRRFALYNSDHLTLMKAYHGWSNARRRGARWEWQYLRQHFLSRNTFQVGGELAQTKFSAGFTPASHTHRAYDCR